MELSERTMVERYELGNARGGAALRSHGGLSLWLLTLALTATLVILLVAMGDARRLGSSGRAWGAVRDGGRADDRRRPNRRG